MFDLKFSDPLRTFGVIVSDDIGRNLKWPSIDYDMNWQTTEQEANEVQKRIENVFSINETTEWNLIQSNRIKFELMKNILGSRLKKV